MVLSLFANIGKAAVLQALGLQKNYTEEIMETVQDIDYSNKHCLTCKNCALIESFSNNKECEQYRCAVSACNNCSYRTYISKQITQKKYINEQNRYGYKPTLKSNAIKLFLLLHFLGPDGFGIIKNVNIDELAGELRCDVKTIKHNLDSLIEYGYIAVSRLSAHAINVYLCDYDKYYLPANKGGRGFYIMSKELLFKLLDIRSIVSLRIHIRELFDFDLMQLKSAYISGDNKSCDTIRQYLPSYCKPCVIKQALTEDAGIFNIVKSKDSKVIKFELNPEYNGKKRKDECLKMYGSKLRDFWETFVTERAYVAHNPYESSEKLPQFFIGEPKKLDGYYDFHEMFWPDKDYMDLASLCLQYSFELVIEAFCEVYNIYINKAKPINNLGGLVRTIIVHHIEQRNTLKAA